MNRSSEIVFAPGCGRIFPGWTVIFSSASALRWKHISWGAEASLINLTYKGMGASYERCTVKWDVAYLLF